MARLFSKSCEASGLGDSDHMCTQRGLHSGGSAKNQLADCAAATHLQKKRCHALPAELANAPCAGLMDRRDSRLGEAALRAKRSAQNDQRSARTASQPRETQPRSGRVKSRLLCDKVSSGIDRSTKDEGGRTKDEDEGRSALYLWCFKVLWSALRTFHPRG